MGEGLCPELYRFITENREEAIAALSIGRGGKKPRKDAVVWSDFKTLMSFFCDEQFRPEYEYPEHMGKEEIIRILTEYSDMYDLMTTTLCGLARLGTASNTVTAQHENIQAGSQLL